MDIEQVRRAGTQAKLLPEVGPDPTGSGGKSEEGSSGASFGDLLQDLTRLGNQSDQAIERFMAGEKVDLHQVMISVEKTEIAFRLALQLRNKLVEAYREIMRMQV